MVTPVKKVGTSQDGKHGRSEDIVLMLLVGTTNGLWEIGALPARRWLRRQQPQHRVLANTAIAALTHLPQGGAIAATTTGKLWQRAPGQRWRRHALGATAPTDTHGHALTTALAVGVDARLWRGTMPVSLWHATLDEHATWQPNAALTAQPEARQWWGPCDPAAPLVSAIAPDPRDAQAMTIAVAVGGVYHTVDGGQTWQAQHRGIAPLVRQDASGYDAHRQVSGLARHLRYPDMLYATSASALYRADTTSAVWRWEDITPPHARALMDLPGSITPAIHERDTAFAILPLMTDETRCTLWETRDGGATWQECIGAPVLPLVIGATAPTTMATIAITPAHIAVVTSGGDVYLNEASDVTAWRHVATALGDVTCACWVAG